MNIEIKIVQRNNHTTQRVMWFTNMCASMKLQLLSQEKYKGDNTDFNTSNPNFEATICISQTMDPKLAKNRSSLRSMD